jgi:hypothetical protein
MNIVMVENLFRETWNGTLTDCYYTPSDNRVIFGVVTGVRVHRVTFENGPKEIRDGYVEIGNHLGWGRYETNDPRYSESAISIRN